MRTLFAAVAVLLTSVMATSTPDPTPLFEHFAGVARMTSTANGTLYERGFGLANIPGNVSMQTDDVFAVASNTKLVTTVAIYQLYERGIGPKSLTDSVSDYLDANDFKNFGHPSVTKYCPTLNGSATCQNITFIDLMSMSSGIPNAAENMAKEFMVYPGSIGKGVGLFIMDKLQFVPGTAYEYSNPNFNLLAYLIEKWSGISFAAYVHKNIASVVGMKKTVYDPQNGKFNRHGRLQEYYYYQESPQHAPYENGVCSNEVHLGCLNGGGGLLSTAPDYERLYHELFSKGGGKLLTQKSVDSLITPRQWINWKKPYNGTFWYGQGLFLLCPTHSHTAPCTMPQFIYYEGQILCSFAANLYSTATGLLSQVFTNNVQFFVNKTVYDAAVAQEYGTFEELTSGWPNRNDPSIMAYQMMFMFL